MTDELITLQDAELDNKIDVALELGDITELTQLLPVRLERNSIGEEYYMFQQARDLYLIHHYNAWDTENYPTFSKWIDMDYSQRSYGRALPTCFNLISLWQYYAIEQGWTLEDMCRAGRTKLERMKGIAIATATEDGKINDKVKDILMDGDIGAFDAVQEYAEREAKEKGEEPPTIPTTPDNKPLFRLYSDGTDRPCGTLEAWITTGDGQRSSVELGTLHISNMDVAEYIAVICERARIEIV